MSITIASFEVAGEPQVKQRARKGRGNRWYTPQETVVAEEIIAYEAMASNVTRFPWPTEKDVKLTVSFYCKKMRGDLDNKIKLVSDALNKVVYRDDIQIKKIDAEMIWVKDNPRTRVTIKIWEGK